MYVISLYPHCESESKRMNEWLIMYYYMIFTIFYCYKILWYMEQIRVNGHISKM